MAKTPGGANRMASSRLHVLLSKRNKLGPNLCHIIPASGREMKPNEFPGALALVISQFSSHSLTAHNFHQCPWETLTVSSYKCLRQRIYFAKWHTNSNSSLKSDSLERATLHSNAPAKTHGIQMNLE